MIFWTPGMTLDEMEKQVILAALRFYHGNKAKTAQALNVSVRTIHNKLEKYDQEATEAGRPQFNA
jgi:DNA-binding NtrC family response regulator